MSYHSLESPSKAAMWMECAGSLALPENQQDGGSSTYADDGTASHTLAAWTLDDPSRMCSDYPKESIVVNGVAYPTDEERVGYIQSYVDDIRRSAAGGILWPEHRVDLSKYLGMAACPTCNGTGSDPRFSSGQQVILGHRTCPQCNGDGEVPQGGTSDAVIILPKTETVIGADLKYGVGEKVYAKYTMPDGTVRINHQLGLYLLGILEDVLLLGYKITTVVGRIYQPRLGWIDEISIRAEDLLGEFASRVVKSHERVGQAHVLPPDPKKLDAAGLLGPADNKTCRWCRVSGCPALNRFMTENTRVNFDDETGAELPAPKDTTELAKAYRALPLIEHWLKVTKAALWNGVNNGDTILGPDGLPLKMVEAGGGKRAWKPEVLLSGEVEAALVGQIGEQAYEPRKPITAPAAAKILDKKKTKELWKDVFEPLFEKTKGSAQIALGSDSRPAMGRSSAASDFDDEIGVE